MVSGTELEILKIIDEAGGQTTIQAVSRKQKVEPNYARLLCTSLGKADYIDVLASGICRMTPKGTRALKLR